jgi:hypothetical protein
MSIMVALFVISGLLLAGLAIPLILGKIPPNGLYGLRVKRTMENPQIWYPANSYAGKWLLSIGLATAAAAILFSFIPNISLDLYAYCMLGFWVLIFTTSIAAIARNLKRMPN